ncbi:HlyD family secretion protein [Planctomycetes bacterium CA13]|uniref:HlyD family secretion protein n=1 Tax=Novipirellula herctigrandis TaxID=2527986 RepID=A0A5C5YVT0_9BACT|nr:HlyD family secretion protein [Planctomycetes bacterium CA13]
MTVEYAPNQPANAVPLVTPQREHRALSETTQLREQLRQMAALSELIARMESSEDLHASCQVLADQLQGFLATEQVLVGLCRDASIECRLTAVSGVATFDQQGEIARSAQACLQECIAFGGSIGWPSHDEIYAGGQLAHRQFAKLANVEAIVSAPLRDASGQLRGAWLVTGNAKGVHATTVTKFLETAGPSVASALKLMTRSEKGSVEKTIKSAREWVKKKGRLSLLAAILFVTVILCLPLHYQAKCDCTVEPVLRRFVAAPFAGSLAKSLVEPGDIVEQGQLLAQMDGREVRMELSGIRADLHRASKERAGHLATQKSGEAEVARYEVDRLQKRTELLEYREHNVDIRSPIAGVVVSGDLKDAEGMPLEVGKTLFEIAPLDEMVVEVGIVEDEFAYVRAGMAVTVRLDAYPLSRFDASIERVHPRAEVRDDQNVFVAEVRLQDSKMDLRPGMKGTARIEADRYPLIWNVFRRPMTAAIAWLGW